MDATCPCPGCGGHLLRCISPPGVVDTDTQGTWKGVYGTDGYILAAFTGFQDGGIDSSQPAELHQQLHRQWPQPLELGDGHFRMPTICSSPAAACGTSAAGIPTPAGRSPSFPAKAGPSI